MLVIFKSILTIIRTQRVSSVRLKDEERRIESEGWRVKDEGWRVMDEDYMMKGIG